MEQFGIFAATYGIAVLHFLESPVQVVVIGEDKAAEELLAAAVAPFAFNKTTLRFAGNQVVAENLPPALAATLPGLPRLGSGKSFAVLCSGTACQPPVNRCSGINAVRCMRLWRNLGKNPCTPRTFELASRIYRAKRTG